MEWQEPMLERRRAEIERTHAEYLRESADTECSINMYRDGTLRRRDKEAGLRQDPQNKKGEAERLRTKKR